MATIASLDFSLTATIFFLFNFYNHHQATITHERLLTVDHTPPQQSIPIIEVF